MVFMVFMVLMVLMVLMALMALMALMVLMVLMVFVILLRGPHHNPGQALLAVARRRRAGLAGGRTTASWIPVAWPRVPAALHASSE